MLNNNTTLKNKSSKNESENFKSYSLNALKAFEFISGIKEDYQNEEDILKDFSIRIDKRSDYQFQLYNLNPYTIDSYVIMKLSVPEGKFLIFGSEGERIPYRILGSDDDGVKSYKWVLIKVKDFTPMGYETFFIEEKEPDEEENQWMNEYDLSVRALAYEFEQFKAEKIFTDRVMKYFSKENEPSANFTALSFKGLYYYKKLLEDKDYVKTREELEEERPFLYCQLDNQKEDNDVKRNLPIKKSFLEVKTKQVTLNQFKLDDEKRHIILTLKNNSSEDIRILLQSYYNHIVVNENLEEIEDSDKLFFKANEEKIFKSIWN